MPVTITQEDIDLAVLVFTILGGLIALFGGVVVYLNRTPRHQRQQQIRYGS